MSCRQPSKSTILGEQPIFNGLYGLSVQYNDFNLLLCQQFQITTNEKVNSSGVLGWIGFWYLLSYVKYYI